MTRLPTGAATDRASTTPTACALCGVQMQRRNMPRHLRERHSVGEKRVRDHGTAQCPECEKYYTAQNLADHRRRMHGVTIARRGGGYGWRAGENVAELNTRIESLVEVCRNTRDPALLLEYRRGLMSLVHQRVKERQP